MGKIINFTRYKESMTDKDDDVYCVTSVEDIKNAFISEVNETDCVRENLNGDKSRIYADIQVLDGYCSDLYGHIAYDTETEDSDEMPFINRRLLFIEAGTETFLLDCMELPGLETGHTVCTSRYNDSFRLASGSRDGFNDPAIRKTLNGMIHDLLASCRKIGNDLKTDNRSSYAADMDSAAAVYFALSEFHNICVNNWQM